MKKDKSVLVCSAPMGAGKTQSFIEHLDDSKNYLLAVPKIDLAESIVERIEDYSDIAVDTIHSRDGEYGIVSERIEKALLEGREGCVLIITQQSLLNIKPFALDGWIVVLDEVPNINNCASIHIGYGLFEDLFSQYVKVDEEMYCSVEGLMLLDVNQRYSEAKRTGHEEALIMYSGLLEDNSEVQLEDHNGQWLIKRHSYKDFSAIIDTAEEFHIMGNGIEKTLFYLYVQAKGYRVEESYLTPEFPGYDKAPTIVVMVEGDKFSKEMQMTLEDGSKSERFNEECFGWIIQKAAIERHDGEDMIVQTFGWMAKDFPFDDYKNVTVTDFDVRGLNDFRDFHRTVNLVHGNPTPIQGRMEERMFEMIGVDPKNARAASRHERHIEPVAQHILRTGQRNIGSQKKAVTAIVPTMEVARQIEEVLQIECNIDTSIMRSAPASKAKQSREFLKKKATELKAKGMSIRAIAKEIDKSPATISSWLKSMQNAA